eukprot:112620_1
MSALCFIMALTFVSSTTNTNDSFHGIPHDTQALVYSYLTPEQHHSIRRLNKASQRLFVQLHPSKSNETNSWMQLKNFLSQLRMTIDISRAPTVWHGFIKHLQHYTTFLLPFRSNYTADQIIMIEKLFCVIISNSKLHPSVQLVVAEHLYSNTTALALMLHVFAIRLSPVIPNSCTGLFLYRTWALAAEEMWKTNNVENRYTLFTLAFMKWMIDDTITTYPMLSQQTVDLVWNSVPDVEFIHYFLSFEQLLIHPIKNRKHLIALIIDDVFAANGTFKSKQLRLFCLRSSVLWNLNYVIEYASSLRLHHHSMMKLLDWIFAYKLTSGAYNVIDVMYLFIHSGIFSIHDILCEASTGEQCNISFDLLKYVIHCRDTMEHQNRLHHWSINTTKETFCLKMIEVRSLCGNDVSVRKNKTIKYHSVQPMNKTRRNRIPCCGMM